MILCAVSRHHTKLLNRMKEKPDTKPNFHKKFSFVTVQFRVLENCGSPRGREFLGTTARVLLLTLEFEQRAKSLLIAWRAHSARAVVSLREFLMPPLSSPHERA